MLSTVSLVLLAAGLILVALLLARVAARQLALSDRLARCEARPTLSDSPSASLSARLDELEQTVEVLANRVKMQRVRNAATHAERERPSDLPDPYKQPDEWRNAVNKRLGAGKIPA